jgi:hypothetical protein
VADNADEASKVTFGSGFDRITDMKQVLMAYYMFSHMIVEGSIKLRYRKHLPWLLYKTGLSVHRNYYKILEKFK